MPLIRDRSPTNVPVRDFDEFRLRSAIFLKKKERKNEKKKEEKTENSFHLLHIKLQTRESNSDLNYRLSVDTSSQKYSSRSKGKEESRSLRFSLRCRSPSSLCKSIKRRERTKRNQKERKKKERKLKRTSECTSHQNNNYSAEITRDPVSRSSHSKRADLYFFANRPATSRTREEEERERGRNVRPSSDDRFYRSTIYPALFPPFPAELAPVSSPSENNKFPAT